eukprot:s2013_g16.t3
MCCWEETGFHHYQDVRDFSLDARSISASSGDCSCLVEESAYFPHAKLLPSSHHSGILEEEAIVAAKAKAKAKKALAKKALTGAAAKGVGMGCAPSVAGCTKAVSKPLKPREGSLLKVVGRRTRQLAMQEAEAHPTRVCPMTIDFCDQLKMHPTNTIAPSSRAKLPSRSQSATCQWARRAQLQSPNSAGNPTSKPFGAPPSSSPTSEGRKPETFEDAWHRKVHESHHAHAEGQAEQLALRSMRQQEVIATFSPKRSLSTASFSGGLSPLSSEIDLPFGSGEAAKSTAQSDLSRLQEENAFLAAQLLQANTEMQSLRERLHEQAVADSELQALRGEVEQKQASHVAEIEHLQSEARRESALLAETQREMQSVREELEKNQAQLRLITDETAALRSDFTACREELAHAQEKLKKARSEAAKRRKREEEQEKLQKEEKRKKQEAKEKRQKEERRKEEKARTKRKITEIVTKLQGASSSADALLPLSKTPKLAHRLLSWLWPSGSGVAVADGSLGNGNDDAARTEVASPILHWLLIGGKFAATAPELRRTEVTHVLNCSERVPFQTSVQTCNMPVFLEDEPDEELSRVLETAVNFLDEAVGTELKDWRASIQGQQSHGHATIETFMIHSVQHHGGRCLVNCRKGMSRSVSIVLAYLILRQDLSLRAAWELVKTQRPVALPNTGFRRQLRQLELAKRGSSSMVAADFNARGMSCEEPAGAPLWEEIL